MDISFSAIISEEHILFAYAAILSELYALILSLIKFIAAAALHISSSTIIPFSSLINDSGPP